METGETFIRCIFKADPCRASVVPRPVWFHLILVIFVLYPFAVSLAFGSVRSDRSSVCLTNLVDCIT